MLKRIARWAIRRFDAFLRHCRGIWEFSQDEGCILRLGRRRCRRAVRLSDGPVLHPGASILEIHLWNERVPPMPLDGADAAWGIRFVRRWSYSMGLLADYWRDNPDLADVRALHAVFAIPGGERSAMQERTLEKMGFEVTRPARTPWRVFAHFWENLYNWAILWTYQPASLRVRNVLRMERCHLWMARERVAARYRR